MSRESTGNGSQDTDSQKDPKGAEHMTPTSKPQRRFIKSVLKSAAECDIQMPWQRGARRAAMIARRDATPQALKRA